MTCFIFHVLFFPHLVNSTRFLSTHHHVHSQMFPVCSLSACPFSSPDYITHFCSYYISVIMYLPETSSFYCSVFLLFITFL